jgi:hypothetical protein
MRDSKGTDFYAEYPSNIRHLKFRTEFAKSGALETKGWRETQMALRPSTAVRSFMWKGLQFLGFSSALTGPGDNCLGR